MNLMHFFCNGLKDADEYPPGVDVFEFPAYLLTRRDERFAAMIDWIDKKTADGQNGLVHQVLRATLQ